MLVQYPLRDLISSLESAAHLGTPGGEAKKNRLEAAWLRDSDLPSLVRRDKYLLALQQGVDAGEFEQAHRYAELLRGSDCPLGIEFHFLWGKALMEIGHHEAAVAQLKVYAAQAGSDAHNYTSALQLLIACELH